MKIYLFDLETKRYLKEGEAIFNPENPKRPHIPAFATKKKPPKYNTCEAPYFINGEWVIRPCYIGKKAVNIETKLIETIYYSGTLKNGWQYVDDITAEDIQNNPDRYQIKENLLVKLSDDEYTNFLKLQEKEKNNNYIKLQLQSLDIKAVRPLRAIISGTQTNEDLTTIQNIEKRAKELRNQLKQ